MQDLKTSMATNLKQMIYGKIFSTVLLFCLTGFVCYFLRTKTVFFLTKSYVVSDDQKTAACNI